MANGQFFCKEGKNFTIEKRFNELPKRLETPRIIAVYNNKFNPKLIAHDLKDPGDRSKVKVGNWCGLSFVGYIPNAIGVLAATPFDRPIISFYFARGLAFVFFLLCLGIALKVIQKYKYILLLYASIPILLHQSTAVSYDVLQISLIPLIFALFVNFFNEKRVKISQLILFYFLLLFFVLIKPGYYPFLILYFLVPFSKLQIRKLHYFLLTSGLFLLGIASIFFIVKNTVLLENALVYWFYADTQLQQKFVIEHPLYFIFVFFNALFASTEPILKFMGTFGWLDYSTNIVVLVSYFIIFVLLLQKLAREESHQISFKFSSFTTLSFVVASTTFLIFLLAYLGGTPPGYPLVLALQGRYFLALIPFLLYLLINLYFLFRKSFTKILLVFLFGLITVNILVNILFRYYDYSFQISDETRNLSAYAKENESSLLATSTVVDKTVQEKINVRENETLGGFEFVYSSPEKVDVLYQYMVKDENCNKVLTEGFLSLYELQNANPYKTHTERFGLLKNKSGLFGTVNTTGRKQICLELEPYNPSKTGSYINLREINGEKFFLLYLKRF